MTLHRYKPAITSPHRLASDAGASILHEGGTAVEAVVACAAALTVVYPHMNSIGGDSFWLIQQKGKKPFAIDASGRSAAAANINFYEGYSSIPARGGISSLTNAGTLSGWKLAVDLDEDAKLPLSRILSAAIEYAKNGFNVSKSLENSASILSSVKERNNYFNQLYQSNGKRLFCGDHFTNPDLANTFIHLSKKGLNDFYQGEIADQCLKSLVENGSPLRTEDFKNHSAKKIEPLTIAIEGAKLFNLPAPTQGAASLMILALVNKLKKDFQNESDWIHLIVEATKRAFILRNKSITDPSFTAPIYESMTSSQFIIDEADKISMLSALEWPYSSRESDTVWVGAIDAQGTLVSFIQSIYWEFGSGIAIPELGFVWNNRGSSFSLEKENINHLRPSAKPFHTLNPAMAIFDDGRRLAYGCMGGEGQPQTQAAIFSRYAWLSESLDNAVSRGRWLLGRTWGEESHSLKIEADLYDEVKDSLLNLGHDIACVPKHSEMMGHAGAILNTSSGDSVAVTDPRSDGAAIVID